MTTETVRLEAEPRQVLGKKVAQLRRQGIIPLHLYGPGEESRSLQCPSQRLIQVLSLAGNAPIAVSIHGEPGEKLAFAREIQWDPRRDTILHVDLMTAEASRPVTAQTPRGLNRGIACRPLVGRDGGAPVAPVGGAGPALGDTGPGGGGPGLAHGPGGMVRAGDVSLPPNVELAGDPEQVVVRIELPAAEESTREPGEA